MLSMNNPRLLLATNNQHKRRELGQIFYDVEMVMPAELGLVFEHEETGASFLDNAHAKALALWQLNGGRSAGSERLPVLADDSGLCVDALGGAPGIYSARYGSPDGGRTELPAAQRNALLLRTLSERTDREAHFVCSMALLFDEDRFYVAQETWVGEIARSPSDGGGGFGYDPVFLLPQRGCTAADLDPEEKNRISHRAKAAAAIKGLLTSVLR